MMEGGLFNTWVANIYLVCEMLLWIAGSYYSFVILSICQRGSQDSMTHQHWGIIYLLTVIFCY